MQIKPLYVVDSLGTLNNRFARLPFGFKWTALILCSFLALSLLACSSTNPAPMQDSPTATPVPSPTPESSTQSRTSIEVLSLAIASTDLAVGPGNRLAFALLAPDGPVRAPTAAVQLQPLGAQQDGGIEVVAVYRQWPVGPGGAFSAFVNFDRAGTWAVEVRVFLPDGVTGIGRTQISVATESSAPAIGAMAPASHNKTSEGFLDPNDPDQLATITSATDPDPDLYRLTVADALESRLPTVVSFATPAFCRTATCGPQVNVLSILRIRHEGEVNFIHIEVYEDPNNLTDLSKAKLVPQMEEWGLRSEPFTFVLDAAGRVAVKFEGFVNENELGSAIAALLDS